MALTMKFDNGSYGCVVFNRNQKEKHDVCFVFSFLLGGGVFERQTMGNFLRG